MSTPIDLPNLRATIESRWAELHTNPDHRNIFRYQLAIERERTLPGRFGFLTQVSALNASLHASVEMFQPFGNISAEPETNDGASKAGSYPQFAATVRAGTVPLQQGGREGGDGGGYDRGHGGVFVDQQQSADGVSRVVGAGEEGEFGAGSDQRGRGGCGQDYAGVQGD